MDGRRYRGRVRGRRLRYRRYRGQRAGGFVVHSRRNIRPYRSPAKFRQIARRPIPMQRIVNKRYRMTNNPFGDRVQYKFKFSAGGSLTTAGGAPFFVVNQLIFNNLADAETRFGSCPGFLDYARLFRRYRVTGMKLRFTPIWNDVTVGSAVVPCGFIHAYSGSTGDNPATPSVQNLPEQRWASWRPLNNWEAGGGTKGLKLYASVMKVMGPDVTVAADRSYSGNTNTTSPWYSAPTGPFAYLRYGIMSMNGANIAAGTYGSYMVTATYYTTFWERKNELDD